MEKKKGHGHSRQRPSVAVLALSLALSGFNVLPDSSFARRHWARA